MSATPEPTIQYKRPERAELVFDGPIALDGHGHSIYQKQWVYKGKVVDFSLSHRFEEVAGHYTFVARYDCCHSEVHKHQMYRSGKEETYKPLKRLDDPNTAWEDVDSAFPVACDDAIDSWEENYRRWNHG